MNDARPKLIALLAVPLLVGLTSGCFIEDPLDPWIPPPPAVNLPPSFDDADAFVAYDPGFLADAWTFQAAVYDPDGPYDVLAVWAHVYDEYSGGVWVASFELSRAASNPGWWSATWPTSSTVLDPYWPGYSVDFVASDPYGDTVRTVRALTY
jgi:hypothetical protein